MEFVERSNNNIRHGLVRMFESTVACARVPYTFLDGANRLRVDLTLARTARIED